MSKKLHLGCGINYKKDWINLDSSKDVKPDVVWNLEKTPLPFEDNSINEILAEHLFEHIKNFIPLMKDLHRICKKNALIKLKVPFYNSCEQYSDPTHVRFFSPFTFNFFNPESNIGKFSHEVECSKKMLDIEKVKINFSAGRTSKLNFIFNPIININHTFYCKFMSGIIPASEIEFELRVVK